MDKVYKNSAGQAENRQPLNQNSDLKHVIQEINVMKDTQNELLEEITFLREDSESKSAELVALKGENADLLSRLALIEATLGCGGGGGTLQAITNTIIDTSDDDSTTSYSSAPPPPPSSSTDSTDSDSDSDQDPDTPIQPRQMPKKNKKNKSKSTATTLRLGSHSKPPVRPAPKTTDIFIGNTRSKTTSADIKKQLKSYANIKVELEDIQELVVKGSRKAFKVSVPYNRVNEATSVNVWGDKIKAEPFVSYKSKSSAHKQKSWPNNNNKNQKGYNNQKKKTFLPPGTQKPWVNAKFGLPTGLPNWTIPTMPQHPAYWNQFPQPQWHPQNQFGY